MDEKILFNALKKQTKSTLLELLYSGYYEMNTQQRRYVFGDLIQKSKPSKIVGKDVIKKSEIFYQESLAGKYYVPFEINSKNFSYIPEETEEWFDKLGDLLQDSTQLTKQEDHESAVKSFEILYKLIEHMEDCEEIIFADEYGSWMIPGREEEYLNAYLLSLAKVKIPEDYAKVIIPLIERDSYSSFCHKIYSLAVKHGNQKQTKYLKDEIEKQNIKTELVR